MPVSYETESRLKALAPVLDEHAEWFGRAVRFIFYPETQERGRQKLGEPESFGHWIRDAAADEAFSRESIAELKEKFRNLHMTAGRLAAAALESGRRPDLEEYESLVSLYESFVQGLRRLERDSVLADSGLDAVSGLRSAQVMKIDLERELERRARRGKPFCVVMARIDDYEHLISAVSEKRLQEIIGIVAQKIKLCLRSFDDAYRIDDGEFVMSLKQTEQTGGSAAVERLRRLLAAENIMIHNRGEQKPLTMSYCVAEPLPGDTFDDLFRNMRADIGRYEGGSDTAFEFKEQSPVQRYVKGVDER